MTNAFGKENVDFIDNAMSKKILDKGYMVLPEYIKTVNFNESKPENHNVYIPNWRDKTRVLVYNGDTWNLQQTSSIIDDIKNKGMDFIESKYDDLDKIKDKKKIDKLDRFLESYNTEEKTKIDILDEDLRLVLYNNRKIPEKTRKKQDKTKAIINISEN